MSEELESPMEKLGEELREEARHGGEGWLKWSALLSVLLAVMAALAGLEAGHYADTAMIEQIEASDQWGYYQAKGIKATLTENQQTILTELKKPTADTVQKLERYKTEQEDIKQEATKLVESAKRDIERHEALARTVTLSQIAIAIIAIAVLTRRKYFVIVAALAGLGGLIFLVQGFIVK